MAPAPWFVIDASHQGELRITHVVPGRRPTAAAVQSYAAADLPTFTDGLLRYERDTGVPLRDSNSVLAIAGAATGDSIPVARSRWTISRSGIAAILGRPPIIVNEVAAQAWATRHVAPVTRPIRGSAPLNLSDRGRFAFLNIGDGVGAALIDIDDRGRVHITDSEAGHLDFAPSSEAETAFARACCPIGLPSWEQLLVFEPSGSIGLGDADGSVVARVQAGLLGRYAANLILAFGAWRGALLTGPRVAQIVERDRTGAFDAAFNQRPSFRRLMSQAGCWQIKQQEAVITGCVALIAEFGKAG